MARLQGRTLFFITSPRTPLKMLPEIELLVENFTGEVWNTINQVKYIELLVKGTKFEGTGSPENMSFSARDRINRGPKALGFVDLKPTIKITEAGEKFIKDDNTEEVLLRQLLKFQLPSPYHTETQQLEGVFYIKPYLEIFRLIYELEYITFDELMLFGMQLTSYVKFDEIVKKIRNFREEKSKARNYKIFFGEYRDAEILEIYDAEIAEGKIKTRESNEKTLAKFIKVKAGNMRDYTDACFRYLRATGLVSISQKGKSLSILPEKMNEVEFFLKNIDRKPCFIDDECAYKKYLFNSEIPVLYSDNRDNIEEQIRNLGSVEPDIIVKTSTNELKNILRQSIKEKKQKIIEEKIAKLKAYEEYEDIKEVFVDITNNNFYDTPLMLEWNIWRAMTMINGGNIKANLKFDDYGQPMSTAAGNMADIVCDYGDFSLTVEATMQSGQRQYEAEGEPVSRHLAKVKKEQDKEAYCFFIAPRINEACIAHFYTLHLANISYYGGKSVIIPLELSVFEKMVEQTQKVDFIPSPKQIQRLCKYSMEIAEKATNEMEWYNAIQEKAINWLVA